ncbi:hypothetical protein ACN28S_67760 [Cystobacter fuscus]
MMVFCQSVYWFTWVVLVEPEVRLFDQHVATETEVLGVLLGRAGLE